jgi:hypothetical protein
LSFRIDQDILMPKQILETLLKCNRWRCLGTVNLANVSKAYPIKLKKTLTGVLKRT